MIIINYHFYTTRNKKLLYSNLGRKRYIDQTTPDYFPHPIEYSTYFPQVIEYYIYYPNCPHYKGDYKESSTIPYFLAPNMILQQNYYSSPAAFYYEPIIYSNQVTEKVYYIKKQLLPCDCPYYCFYNNVCLIKI